MDSWLPPIGRLPDDVEQQQLERLRPFAVALPLLGRIRPQSVFREQRVPKRSH